MAICVYPNPSARRGEPMSDHERSGFDPALADRAKAALRKWPIYGATPLRELSGLAGQLGIGRLWTKDEAERRPLNSFKTLGGAYALAEAILDEAEKASGTRPSQADLWEGRCAEVAADFHVVAATDGNHGRSVAWAASQFGCSCTIYLPSNVSPAREAAIAEFGAEIVRIAGTWDDALAVAVEASRSGGKTLIQDSSFEGYTEHCRRIMEGYALMSEEARQALPDNAPPTHVFLQTGCGGLAAAVAGDLWDAMGPDRPTIVVVQSKHADAMVRTVLAGERRTVGGEHATMMVGIACGEISLLAWKVLERSADFVVTIDDAPAAEMMRLCAQGSAGDEPVEFGETGVAGLAALAEAMRDPEARAALGLDSNSRVLTFATEGVIDRPTFERIVRGSATA